ncbi:MAG: MraY family glycosyltransferase [Gammaproteobacteria bacterium]
MILFVSFLLSLLVTMALIPPLMASAGWLKVMDLPDARKQHGRPVPRIGGIAMTIGAVAPILVWLAGKPIVTGYLLGVAIILLFGVWDDRQNLSHRVKFGAQILAAIIVVKAGVVVLHLPFMGPDPIPYAVGAPFTVFALVAVTNAINLADGLDGLAGGTTLLTVALTGLLAWQAQDQTVTLIAIAVAGCILGFLRFNTHPAQIFMGDAGSQFLGFSAGVLAVLVTQRSDPALSQAVPVLLLGLPILDTTVVFAQRIYEGRSPFKADRNHIHHKLLALGMDHYEAVLSIYVFQATLVTAAYFLRYESDGLLLGLYTAIAALVALGFRHAARTGWRFRAAQPVPAAQPASRIGRVIRQLRESGVIVLVAAAVAAIAIVLVVANAVVSCTGTRPLTLLATGLVAVLVLGLGLMRSRPLNFVERAGIYLTLALAVYLQGSIGGPGAALVNAAFVVLVIVVLAGFRYTVTEGFKFTTLDFLVLFAAVVIPNLTTPHSNLPELSGMIAKLFVLLYGTEFLLARAARRMILARLFFIGAAGALAAGGFAC